MAKFARGLSGGSVRAAAVLLAALTLVAGGQAAPAPAAGVRERLARAVNIVLTAGFQAKIPPHVSAMLGISAGEQECLVSQRYERNGKLVRGFNVSLTDNDNIVLFVTDENTNEQTYYLTSGRGRLRKVLAVREGTGHALRITGKENAAFEKELQFWLDRIVPRRASN